MFFRILFYLTILGPLASIIASALALPGANSLETVMVRWHEKNMAGGLADDLHASYQNQTLVLLKIIRGMIAYVIMTSVLVFAVLIAALRKICFRRKEIQPTTL
jgi:hypothetical protein